MFQKLRKKYTLLLLSAVAVIFVTYSLAVFLLYCRLLREDYDNKINYFRNQQIANAESYLQLAEFNIALFCAKFQFQEDDKYLQAKIRYELEKIKNTSLDIEEVFLIRTDSQYAFTQDAIALAEFLQEQHPELLEVPYEAFQWYYLKYGNPSEDKVLCLKSLQTEDGKENQTLGVTIPAVNILPVVSNSGNDMGIFSEHHFSASLLPEEAVTIVLEEGGTEQEVLSDSKTEAFYGKVGTFPFTLCIATSQEPLNRVLFRFFLGMAALCGFLFLAAYVTLQWFLRKLTGALTSLSNQFAHFFDVLEGAEEISDG